MAAVNQDPESSPTQRRSNRDNGDYEALRFLVVRRLRRLGVGDTWPLLTAATHAEQV